MYETKQKYDTLQCRSSVSAVPSFAPEHQYRTSRYQPTAGNITWKNKITSFAGIFSPKPASVFFESEFSVPARKRKQPDFLDKPEIRRQYMS